MINLTIAAKWEIENRRNGKEANIKLLMFGGWSGIVLVKKEVLGVTDIESVKSIELCNWIYRYGWELEEFLKGD